MIEELQLDATEPDETYAVTLDGAPFVLRILWSKRRDGWFLSLSTPGGIAIVTGQLVTIGYNMLAGAVALERPMGVLYAYPREGGSVTRPGRYGLGTRGTVGLYYSGVSA